MAANVPTSVRLTNDRKQALATRFGSVQEAVNALADAMDGIEETAGFFDDPASVLVCLTEAFPVLIRRAWVEMRGVFTRGELMMIADVSNGTVGIIAGAGRSVGENLSLSVEDSFVLYPGVYEEKWGVTVDLVNKLRGATSFQRVALEFWARHFWVVEPLNTPEHDDEMMALLGV